jgi:hypothetical protein
MLISAQGTGKSQLELDQENTWIAVQSVTLFFAQKVSTKTDRCAGAFYVKGKPTVHSTFFGAFLSDRTPEAKKDANAHIFIHSSNSCKLYERILETFSSYFVLQTYGML